MEYNGKSIYQIYFPNSQWIGTMQDLEFDKYNNYQIIQMIKDIKQLFLFLDLESIINKTKIFFIEKVFLPPVFLSTAILKEEDNNF